MNCEKREIHEKVLFPDECYAIQGAIFDVYKEMGCGFLKAVYQECLEKEFAKRSIPFQPQVELQLEYKGEALEPEFPENATMSAGQCRRVPLSAAELVPSQ